MKNLRFSKRVILAIGWRTLETARMHVNSLCKFGITNEKLDAFQHLLEEGESIPADLENRVNLRHLTSTKDDLLDECYRYCDDLFSRLDLTFGKDSVEYLSYPSEEVSDAKRSEQKMLEMMNTVMMLTEKHKVVLAEHGQIPEILEDGYQLQDQLRGADTVQETKKVDRSSETEERNLIFENIYDRINQINRVGRATFRNDPVKYELFRSPWPRVASRQKKQSENTPDVVE